MTLYLIGSIGIGANGSVEDDVPHVGEGANYVEQELRSVAALHVDDGGATLVPVLDRDEG